MAIQNVKRCWTFDALANINGLTAGTGHIFKAVSQGDGNIAANGLSATGILQYVGNSGDHVTYGFDGIMKYTAGIAVNSADVPLTVTTSGYFLPAGPDTYVVGRSLAAVSSGEVGYGIFDFTSPQPYLGGGAAFAITDVSAQANLASAAGLAIDTSAGDVAATSPVADGVLVTGTTSGGTSKALSIGVYDACLAAAAITQGVSLKITTGGYFTTGNSGDVLVGRAMTAASSGGAFTAAINFATPHYATSCLDVVYG